MADINVYDGIVVTEDVADSASHGTADLTLPLLTATGLCGVNITAVIILPSLVVEGRTGAVVEIELPKLTSSGSSISGVVCEAELELPKLVVVGESSSPVIVSAALILPKLTASGTSIHSVLASGAMSLPKLWAAGLTSLNVGVIGYALNLRTLGLSEYEGYNFNSLCIINGKPFGAGSTGLYLLEGSDDEGVNIDAHATFPLTDFGMDNEKRVRSVYFGGDADKRMKLHVWANEGDERVRMFRPTTTKGKIKVPVGRGEEGEYWQFKVSNLRGADFEINSLECFLVVLRRGGYLGS